ncbi:dynein regulatory complex subunit 2 [Diorhabda carinulata]|uniref:dynein regulatory complex subunit 2 n=1 Tax=Diorhabda carinulata TaxID=1163345 RepID=UPI0025A2B7F9|nr:dynein regulatory complex subunit 2 [Diorhabda carinulata]
MGGKKKSVANKLAKMSDEERARYMQHRAEMEEEAKRRKEQLIATFMKKKVKKEEAFSRLNLAKINQNWHQILRKTKCQEMKENIEHLRKWIERVIQYKNETISRLVKELDVAEDDYITNLSSHSNHIDKILENQNEYMNKLNAQYQEDLNRLLREAEVEKENILKNAEEQQMHLKTILYRQGMNEKHIKEEEAQYVQKYYEDQYEFESKLEKMRSAREEVCCTIWRGIEKTIQDYIDKTNPWRMHIAELKRLDRESAEEISRNKERILQDESLKENIKEELDRARTSQEHELTALSEELVKLQKKFNKLRTQLNNDLKVDEKKLKVLVEVSDETKRYLEGLVKKGNCILNLLEICKTFETDREKIMQWYHTKVSKNYDEKVKEEKNNVESVKHQYFPIDDEKEEEHNIETVKHQYSSNDYEKEEENNIEMVKHEYSLNDDEKEEENNIEIVKHEYSPEFGFSSTLGEIIPSDTTITAIKNVTVQDKHPVECSLKNLPIGLIDDCLKDLERFENFWMKYNKVEVDYLDILGEKKHLQEENKQLRGMIRAVLEATALSHSIPNSKVSTRIPSRRISARSAPLRRMVF